MTNQAIEEVLNERGNRYGTFEANANTSQELKRALAESGRLDLLTPVQQEALEMICHKMSRIVNGDSNYKDSWTDIIGYAKLVEDRL